MDSAQSLRMTDVSYPFRASAALNQGKLTRRQLRGRHYQRLFQDVYLAQGAVADLRTRSYAAYLLVADHGALAGYSALEWLGAQAAPRDADAEVLLPQGAFRERPGLRVHRDRLSDDEVCTVKGVNVTTPVRTAYDLARWLPLVDAVVAVDALCRHCYVKPERIRSIHDRYPRVRGRRRVEPVIALADPRAESPMETRLRLNLVMHGLPKPTPQHWVTGPGGRRARLDLAYPEFLMAIEYDGDHHRNREVYATDRRRDNWLTEVGWLILRFAAADALGQPEAIARQVGQALHQRSHRPRT